MERLTIKELAPYLPYDLKGVDYFQGHRLLRDITLHNVMAIVDGDTKLKPLLRPLSSINLKWFQDNIDEALEDFRINYEPENNHFSVEVCDKILGWSALSLEEYQLFYRDHIDIHGLIDRGLAL